MDSDKQQSSAAGKQADQPGPEDCQTCKHDDHTEGEADAAKVSPAFGVTYSTLPLQY